MPRSRRKFAVRLALVLVALMALMGLGLGLLNMARESSKRVVEAKYRAIRPGMNHTEVRRLMQGVGTVMYTGIGSAELMHVEGRYMIAVVYRPDPKDPSPTIYPNGVPHDDWIVKEKLFLELGRGTPVDNMMVQLNLREPRSVGRVTTPE